MLVLEGCQGPVVHKGDRAGCTHGGSQTKERALGILKKRVIKDTKMWRRRGRGRGGKEGGEGELRI